MKTQAKTCWRICQAVALILLGFILATSFAPDGHLALAQPGESLMFIENVGQFDGSTRFQTHGGPATLSLTDDALWFTLFEPPQADAQAGDVPAGVTAASTQQGVNLRLSFVDANPQPQLEPFNRLDTRVAYFTGRDPANWQVDVPVWGGVRYVDLYPGIDLELTGENGQLVPRLVRHDGDMQAQSVEALSNVALRVEGAQSLALDEAGRLQLTTAVGDFTLPLLVADQAGMQIAAAQSPPRLDGEIVSRPFAAASPLPDTPVQIAGVSDLLYSTFLGGSGNMDAARDIAVDESGSAYVAGQAYPGFPTTPGAFDTGIDGVESDAFVAKLTPDGSGLVYATFLGGSDFDTAWGLTLDESGNAYLAGSTKSTDFPTTPGAIDTTVAGPGEAFVAKINTTGSELVYATLLGGAEGEFAWHVAVDEAGNAYVTGFTESPDFPTTPDAFNTTLDTWYDIFVAKLNADATALFYSGLLGGENADYSYSVAIDGAGSAYVTGYTLSNDFPVTPGSIDTGGDRQEVFVVKVNPDGRDLAYVTCLGGSEGEYAQAITVDATGRAYIIGLTGSADFPVTAGAFDTSYNTTAEYTGDSFVAALTPDGSEIAYATFLGGSDNDIGYDLAVDDAGNIYVAGETYSVDFPTTANAFDTLCESCSETFPRRVGFAAKLIDNGSTLAYATFLGGSQYDTVYGLAVDAAGHAYVAGDTSSTDFPITTGAFDATHEGFNDGFVAKLTMVDSGPPPTPTPTPPPVPAHNCSPAPLGDITVGDTPRGIAVDPTRQRVYVANFGSNSVSVIDSNTNTVIDTITGITAANGIAHDALHNMLWVTNYTTNQVTPIQVNGDATAFTVLPPIDVGAGPWGVVYSLIYGQIFVANNLDDSVTVINVGPRTVAATLTGSFSQPFHLTASPITGKVYVANFGNNSVTVLKGATISRVVDLYDSSQPYGIAIDPDRNKVYIATVAPHRIVVIGTLHGVEDQFLGWAAFYRGFGNRNRPVPLRAIAVNPDMGPFGDGGHIWATTATADGSEQNQALLIPKGWSSYFHYPLAQAVAENPGDGIAVDRVTDRVYVSGGAGSGTVTVIGDHPSLCPGVGPAGVSEDVPEFDFDIYTPATLSAGDVTGDGQVDILDLAFIASRYKGTDPAADVNRDGQVDILDLSIAAQNYGQTITVTD